MRLILWISSPTPDVERTHTFGEEGGTIGRGADNSWVLRHPKVSAHHAVISFSDGQFFIQDTSDLGVLVNYVREIGPRCAFHAS
jgi:type VI secretion system protein